MTIKLYGFNWYTNPARVVICLYEKDVNDFELVPVDLTKNEQKSPDYLKIQPFGLLPVLKDGDLTLFESRPICRFLCHKFEGQGTALYGTTPKDKALVEQWLEVESQNFNANITALAFNIVLYEYFGNPIDEAAIPPQLAKLESVLDVYEKQLSKTKYLAGDFFSLADLSHFPFLHYTIKVAKTGDVRALVNSRPRVKAWWEDITSRPSYKKWLSQIPSKQQGTFTL